MTPTAPSSSDPLRGLDAFLAGSGPLSQPVQGGIQSGFWGETSGKAQTNPSASASSYDANGVQDMGYVLTAPDADVFEHVHGLVLRQEMLAQNRLACDTHWGYVVTGYPWSTLTKEPGRDTYKQTLPYGSQSIKTQAVPNKAWDLLNKTAETLLVDFPQSEAQPLDSSEEAESACDLANKFLEQDAGEKGTNDEQLFFDRTLRSLFTATSFIEAWTDPTGNGYVPLTIKAHPHAVDPNNAMVGPDGMPTTDYVLRMVTQSPVDGPEGPQFPPGTQFTDDPEQAAPLWLPKLRAAKWNREHVRVYPETARVEDAEKVIILGYCTLSEAKRRWANVAAMGDDAGHLTDWTPIRYLALLPPFLRARWKLTDSRKEKQGSGDERTMFYYHVYIKACPDYPKGADVVVSGINGGMILDKRPLSKPVTVKDGKTEVRCMEIPVVQVTPVADPFDMDPQGRSFIELFAGAVENSAMLTQSFAQLVSDIVHPVLITPSTSPIDGQAIKEARATGNAVQTRNPTDKPDFLQAPPIPESAFFRMYEVADDAINSIAAQNRPAQGSDNQQEVSGRAREIAVQQNNVANTSKSTAVNLAYARWCRIKIEKAMADFEVPQLVAYEGEDGAQKVRQFTGMDFALVGPIAIKAGTGTMLTPDQKVQYLGNLQAAGLLPQSEAAEAARQSFAKRLGVQPDVHEQYVERCIASWLEGPPSPEWVQQYDQWQQAQAEFQQAQAQYQQQAQLFQQAEQMKAVAAGGAPPVALGPEQQNDQAMIQYQQAVEWLTVNAAQIPPAPPQPPQPPQIPEPWSPFAPRPNETEPAIAAMWARKLSNVMSSVQYDRFVPEWKNVLDRKYNATRQSVATATGATPGSPPQSQPVGTPQPEKPVQSPSFPGPRPTPGKQMPTQQHPGQNAQSPTPTAAKAA